MPEKNFGGGPENFQGIQPLSETGEGLFDVEKIHAGIPHIESPGPKIGPDFSDAKNEKEAAVEHEIDEIIIKAYEYIDLNDLETSYGKVIQKLQEENIYNADDYEMNRHIEITFGLVVNNIQNQERKFLEDKLNRSGRGSDGMESRDIYNSFERMAINDAEWMHEIQKYIIENRENPEIISAFWKDFDKYYLTLKKEYGNLLEEDRNSERIMHGISAEIAAKSLIEKLGEVLREENIPGWDKVNITVSDVTSVQDVREKTDFKLLLNEEVIPCQVKSCVIHPKEISVGSVEKEASRRKKYAEQNSFTIVYPDSYFKETEQNGGPWQEKNIEKMIQFRNIAVKGKHDRGCYFLFSVGQENGEELLKEDGTVPERIEKMFFKKIVKRFFDKDIYLDLDEKASRKKKKNLYRF